MLYMKKNNFGFTLIELLIVLAILPIISLVIYSTFNKGVHIWQRVNTAILGEDLHIFCEKFTSDLRNTYRFQDIKFSGKQNIIEFPSLVNSLSLNKRTVGQIIYSYNLKTKILDRKKRDFPQIYSGEEGVITQSLENVKSVEFQYYFYDSQKKEYSWSEESLEGKIPLAVRMKLEVINGTEIDEFIKTASIPIAG